VAALSSSRFGNRSQTSQAILILFALTILGALYVNIMGQSVSLSFVPLIGVCLWPRHAHPIVSIIAIFLLGLLFDFITNEALGFRTIIYLTIFAVFRPDTRLKRHILGTALAQWLGAILLAMLVVYFLGWLGRGTRPHLMTLAYQALLATAFFPVVYMVRHFLRYIFLDADERY